MQPKSQGQGQSHSLDAALAALRRMTAGQLREKYLEVFNEPTRSGNKDFLVKRLAWRIQSQVEGTLSERARRRAEELARDGDIRTTLPRVPMETPVAPRPLVLPAPRAVGDDRLPIAGTVLTRLYRGVRVEVKVLPQGFEYQNRVYRSLSAVAKAVTGSHWNGLLFFGLTQPKEKA